VEDCGSAKGSVGERNYQEWESQTERGGVTYDRNCIHGEREEKKQKGKARGENEEKKSFLTIDAKVGREVGI